jgi:hypothetical protein
MDNPIGLGGLGLMLFGAVIAGLADAWYSRAVLVYLDAVEANLEKVVEALRGGATHFTITDINLRRDRGQDRARAVKLLGWCTLVVGVGLQFASLWSA